MSSKPEVQLVAITRRDGGVSIMQFVTAARRRGEVTWRRKPTDEAIAAEIAKAQLDCVSWRRIEPGDIPQDRQARSAWVDDGRTIAAR